MTSLTFFGKPYGSKNSLVVRQVHVPLYKIDTMVECQPTVKIKMIFEMTKEAFYAIGGRRYFWIAQVMEHVGQCAFDGMVGTSQ